MKASDMKVQGTGEVVEPEPVPVVGVEVNRVADRFVVNVAVGGRWVTVVNEVADGIGERVRFGAAQLREICQLDQ